MNEIKEVLSPYQSDSAVAINGVIIFVFIIFYFIYWWGKDESKRKIFPSLCTALGVLGTFFFLALSFSHIDINNSEDVKRLPLQLSGAFITSIIGIIFSQIFTYRLSVREIKEKQKEEFLKISPEEILYNIWQDNRKGQEEFTDKFTSLNNNIYLMLKLMNEAIPTMTGSFNLSMSDFSKKMDLSVTLMNKKVIDQMEELTSDFRILIQQTSIKFDLANEQGIDRMHKNMGDLNNKMNESFDNLIVELRTRNENQLKLEKETHKEHLDALLKSGESNIEVINSLKDQMESIATDMESKFQEICDNFNTGSQKVIEISNNRLEKMVDRVDNMTSVSRNAIQTTANTLKETVQHFDETVNDQEKVIATADEIINTLKQLQVAIENDQVRFAYLDNKISMGANLQTEQLEERTSVNA